MTTTTDGVAVGCAGILTAEERTRQDEQDDSIFYSYPRFVQYVDEGFCHRLQGRQAIVLIAEWIVLHIVWLCDPPGFGKNLCTLTASLTVVLCLTTTSCNNNLQRGFPPCLHIVFS